MGAGLPPLEFTECMSDSPSFRENLHKHEKELENTSAQIKRLIKEVKDLLNAAKQLSNAQRSFSKSLQGFSFECIGGTQTDDERVISRSLQEFGKLIGSIEDQRDRMLDVAYDQIITPLEKFRKDQIGGVKNGKKKFDKQTAKFCASQERYLNLTNKKQNAVLQEADASVDMAERHFYQASMEYVCLIQEVQERKKFEFVETLSAFMYGWLTFYHQGHEVAQDFKPYMNDLQYKIQKTRTNFEENSEKLRKKMTEVQKQYQESEPILATRGRKEGYLFLLEKKAFGTRTKHFCTYDKERKEFTMMPYNQLATKTMTKPDVLQLTSCVRRMSETIEKRFCFDLQVDQRPGIVYTFQALNDSDRKSWMDIMDGKEPTYVQPGNKVPNAEERVLDDTGVAFVNKCIEVLESRGLEEQGLYRVVGVASKVTKLLSMGLDRRKAEKLSIEDPLEWESKTITSALKSYLRNLPEPLMTHRYHNGFIAAVKNETKLQRVNDVHTLIYRIPKQNLEVLRILLKHLTNVAARCDKNLMTVSNLGVCFGPTLLRPEEETVASIMDLKFYNIVVEILIENFEKIFNTPPERDYSPQNSPHAVPSVTNNGRRSPTPTNNGRSPYIPSMNNPRINNSAMYSPISTTVTCAVGFSPQSYMSASLRNVHDPINGGQNIYMSRSEHPGLAPVQLQQNHRFNHHQSRFNSPGISTLSESNLTSLHAYSPTHSIKPYSSNRYDQNSTSSSNESVSSTSREGNSFNHISNHYISPEKTKRTNVGLAYPKGYRSQGSMAHECMMRRSSYSPSSVSSGRSSPCSSGVRRVRTLYACLGENDGELSFEPNQIITNVKSSQEPGWLEGTLNGKTGLVPENYVEVLP